MQTHGEVVSLRPQFQAKVVRLHVCACVQAKLMSECSSSIDSVKRVKLILNDDEEELEDPGLTVGTADKQTSTGRAAKVPSTVQTSSCNFTKKKKKGCVAGPG